MSIQSLRGFQEEAVTSGVGLFTAAKELLAAAGADAAGRAAAINHNGYLLIEAATGSGKTLMAGTIVERFTQIEDVVWFWFAPFKGVVGQSAAFLREQRRDLEKSIEDLESLIKELTAQVDAEFAATLV